MIWFAEMRTASPISVTDSPPSATASGLAMPPVPVPDFSMQMEMAEMSACSRFNNVALILAALVSSAGTARAQTPVDQ